MIAEQLRSIGIADARIIWNLQVVQCACGGNSSLMVMEEYPDGLVRPAK
jgi:hypothetical protein